MKRYLTLASILAVSVFLIFSAIVSADDEVVAGNQNRPSFIDEDGDGVCDNTGKSLGRGQGWGKQYRANFVDDDGDGICDNTGLTLRRNSNRNFVDADEDGVCDNCLNGECEGGNGAGFVDADGDGICDNFTGSKNRGGGKGQGNGGRGRSGK